MLETELKILEINKEEITKKLLSLGATPTSRELYIEEAFDYKNKRIKKSNQLCRLRQQGKIIKLTHKGPKQKSKKFSITKETEIEVSDYSKTKKILENLGLSSYRYREKYRTKFKYNNLIIELDEHPKIPPYIEIEGSKENILNTIEKLGYTISDTTTITASEVLKKYGQNPHYQKFEK